jgi:hypothetical protein
LQKNTGSRLSCSRSAVTRTIRDTHRAFGRDTFSKKQLNDVNESQQ